MIDVRKIVCLAVLAGALLCASLVAEAEEPETVVILHGIAKNAGSMSSLDKFLQQAGYKTVAITYPSTKNNLDGLAQSLRKSHLNESFWQDASRVHFVTHSMGGLVARRYLDSYKSVIPAGKLGRIVMLAPPNQGSEVADLLHRLPPYDWYYGPAGQELTTAVQDKNHSDIYYDLGIIAGTKEWPYIAAQFVVPGKSDGRVSVENTKLDGMKDHITVNGTHTFIMDKSEVHKQVARFLKQGSFDHGE